MPAAANVLRPGLRPGLPLYFAATGTRRPRPPQSSPRQRPTARTHRIGTAGRSAPRNKGGEAGAARLGGHSRSRVPCCPDRAQSLMRECEGLQRGGAAEMKPAANAPSPFGPLQTFAIACERLRAIGTAGRSAPRMSPESGCARLSSFISRSRAPCRPDLRRAGCWTVEGQRLWRPGTAGARRSEIKGEPWAQPRAEDIRCDGHPLAPAGAKHGRARTNVCNGPRADARFMRRGLRAARWNN